MKEQLALELTCPSCGETDVVFPAVAERDESGNLRLIYGSAADFCDFCDEPRDEDYVRQKLDEAIARIQKPRGRNHIRNCCHE